ncbi:hypothetical protein FBQ96_06495 [Nitrospirales bacterium NOB]|nr:MAG: hypothetical protein UZ03_NOB001002095 [Nitrospira sp. OLB3]MBV6470052.1 hypothetical protein [Nitrospirota bacterium]MCK6501664.1 hypothetical protein [Nitrospira sp.]MDL1889218.1 hypothetical protein [Nitrospirales bacterium NOB]MEB2337982.1 hypothetical protein [Nitrospirales bacterium]
MAQSSMTPAEVAAALYKLIPRRITTEMLSDYGIEGSEDQAIQITREVLSFALYWVSAAVNAHIPKQYREVLWQRVLELIRTDWESAFGLGAVPWETYLAEMEERRTLYAPVGDCEGGAIAASEAISDLLEDEGLIQPADRSKLLVLLPDLVPLDRYQALLSECA